MELAAASTAPPTLPQRIHALRMQLESTISGLEAGARTLRDAQLDGDDWQQVLQAATRASGAQWRMPHETLRAVRSGAAELGTDPLAVQARAAIDGAVAVADRGWNAMGRAYMQFWSAPEQRFAPLLTSHVANLGDRTVDAVRSAIVQLDALMRTTGSTAPLNRVR